MKREKHILRFLSSSMHLFVIWVRHSARGSSTWWWVERWEREREGKGQFYDRASSHRRTRGKVRRVRRKNILISCHYWRLHCLIYGRTLSSQRIGASSASYPSVDAYWVAIIRCNHYDSASKLLFICQSESIIWIDQFEYTIISLSKRRTCSRRFWVLSAKYNSSSDLFHWIAESDVPFFFHSLSLASDREMFWSINIQILATSPNESALMIGKHKWINLWRKKGAMIYSNCDIMLFFIYLPRKQLLCQLILNFHLLPTRIAKNKASIFIIKNCFSS